MKRLLVISMVFSIIILPQLQVEAKFIQDTGIKSKNFSLSKDMDLKGVFGSDSYYFYIDENWSIRSASFNLVFTQSQLVKGEESTITVYMNSKPVYSFSLANKPGYKQTVNIPLPLNYISSKYNEIKVQAYRRISENTCDDDNNAANWLIVHGDSFIHVNFQDRVLTNSIGAFPYPFMKASDEIPPGGIIVIPDDFTNDEASAAMMLAAYFGSVRKYDNLNIRVYRFSEAPKNSDMIFIGKLKQTPAKILKILSSEQIKNAKKYGVIKEGNSPYASGRKIMLLISDNGYSIINAARLLSNSELAGQIKESSFIVGGGDAADKVEAAGQNIVFKDLGYSDINLVGPFRQETSFEISIPKNRIVSKGSRIVLYCRYSKNLDFNRSLLTVYVNDIPVGSKRLSLDNADNDTFEILLPQDVIKSNFFDIRAAFDLEIKDLNCITRQEEEPWAYILRSSYAYLPYTDGNSFLFENYSNPFVSEGRLNNVLMVLPENTGSRELALAGNMAAFMGHDVITNKGSVEVLRSMDFSKAYYRRNLVVIGSPEENVLIKVLNKNKYIKYNSDFTAFSSNDKVSLTENYSKGLASIELIDSPFDKSAKVMVFTSPNENNLYNAGKYLTDFTFIAKIKGNAALIDTLGSAVGYYFGGGKANKTSSIKTLASKVNLSEQTKLLIAFFSFIILFIIIFIAVILKKYKRYRT